MKLRLFAAASLFSVPALAQEAAPAPAVATSQTIASTSAAAPVRAAKPKKLKDVSLTISPFHLAAPIFELMGEFRVNDKVGIAVIGGVGQITLENACTTFNGFVIGCSASKYNAFEAGAQGAYYFLGDFNHGMQIGAEVLYVHIASNGGLGGNAKISGNGEGLAVSPFVGYKYVAPVGLTLLAQVGPSLLAIRGEAASGTTTGSSSSAVGLMLNLNAGWSF